MNLLEFNAKETLLLVQKDEARRAIHQRILEASSRTLNDHGCILAHHTEILSSHTRTLAEQSMMLADQGRRLTTIEHTVDGLDAQVQGIAGTVSTVLELLEERLPPARGS